MVVDVDPRSKTFGNILMDIPLPPDLLAHRIFYNKDMTKAYLTALGKPLLHVIDMKRFLTGSNRSPCRPARSARISFSPTTTKPGTSPARARRT